MAAPGVASSSVTLEAPSTKGTAGTNALLMVMLGSASHVSDLFFSPGAHPKWECTGNSLSYSLPGPRR